MYVNETWEYKEAQKIINKIKMEEGTRITIDFANENQAKAFYDWLLESGFDELTQNDRVHDQLPQEEFYSCISSNELPGALNSYYIEIE